MKTLNIWRLTRCICEVITEGRYTLDDASAAPKRAPAVDVLKISMVRMIANRMR
jgi:hypothetical protein